MMSFGESEEKTDSSKFYGADGEFILHILNEEFHPIVQQPSTEVSVDSPSHTYFSIIWKDF